MMPKKLKCWSESLGSYGCTVRVAERSPGGVLYLVWLDRDGKQQKRSLGHSDRRRGKAAALELANRIASMRDAFAGAKLTVGTLIDIYARKGLAGRSNAYVRETTRKLARWRAYLGSERAVVSLSPSDVTNFMESRRRSAKRTLSDSTLWHDWIALNTALHFATKEKDAHGNRLLAEHPLRDVKVSKTVSPARPVARREFYEAIRDVADQLPWQFGLALDLAFATGHRIGAILNLRWSDVDFSESEDAPHGWITWRAEHDKLGNRHTVPMNAIARSALERARTLRPSVGEALVLTSPTDDSLPLERRLANRWFRRAEKLAGLTHVRGRGWHALRRGWASARMHLPDRTVADAGGWRDLAVMKEAYQHSTPAGVLKAVLASA